MPECAFCGIVTGEQAAYVLYEDNVAIAFLDRNPAVPGHTLIAPTAHTEFLFTGDEQLPSGVFRAVNRVARALDRALEPDGVSVFYTSANLVGTVTHAHVHLIPRASDDAIHATLERGSLDPEAADRLARRIRANL